MSCLKHLTHEQLMEERKSTIRYMNYLKSRLGGQETKMDWINKYLEDKGASQEEIFGSLQFIQQVGRAYRKKQDFTPPPPIPDLDRDKPETILRRIAWIVQEWERGCSNTNNGEIQPPEKCEDCTAAAVSAIKSIL